MQRRLQIADRIRQERFLHVEELAEQNRVSAVTIRGDLAYLEEQGLLIRANGGAHVVGRSAPRHAAGLTKSLQLSMMRPAASVVGKSMTVLLGPGSLPGLLPPYLPQSHHLRLIITSLDTLHTARHYAVGPVYLLGGQIHSERQEIDGPTAVQALSAYDIDLFVMEANGLNAQDMSLRVMSSQPLHVAAIRTATRSMALINPVDDNDALLSVSSLLSPGLDYIVTVDDQDRDFHRALHRHGFRRRSEDGYACLYDRGGIDPERSP